MMTSQLFSVPLYYTTVEHMSVKHYRSANELANETLSSNGKKSIVVKCVAAAFPYFPISPVRIEAPLGLKKMFGSYYLTLPIFGSLPLNQ